MLNFIPFILIIISLLVIIVVVGKKFPQLSLLDVDSIPEAQLKGKKDKILKQGLFLRRVLCR